MISLRALIHWNLLLLLRPWQIACCGGLFALIGWYSAGQAQALAASGAQAASVWDAFLIATAGPGMGDTSLLPMLLWLLPIGGFLYLLGDSAYGEIEHHGGTMVSAVGSRVVWWYGKLATLGLAALGYAAFSTGMLLVSINLAISSTATNLRLPPLHLAELPPLALVGAGALLGVAGLFSLGAALLALSLCCRSSFHSFIIIISVLSGSWLLGGRWPALLPWLPSSQSILLMHLGISNTPPTISIPWSLGYAMLISISAIWIGHVRIRQLDMFP